MTNDQTERLIAALERIADLLDRIAPSEAKLEKSQHEVRSQKALRQLKSNLRRMG